MQAVELGSAQTCGGGKDASQHGVNVFLAHCCMAFVYLCFRIAAVTLASIFASCVCRPCVAELAIPLPSLDRRSG